MDRPIALLALVLAGCCPLSVLYPDGDSDVLAPWGARRRSGLSDFPVAPAARGARAEP